MCSIQVYSCACGAKLVNQTETQINAHIIQNGCKGKLRSLSYFKRKPRFTRGLKKSKKKKKLQVLRNENSRLLKLVHSLKSLPKRTQDRIPHPFYDSRDWLELRYKALKLYGRSCMQCKATNCEIHVDHIKPRSKYPELELELSNLQILCRSCNIGKSNKDETDFRPKL